MNNITLPYRCLVKLWSAEAPAEKLTDEDSKLNIRSLANSTMLRLSTVLTTLGNDFIEEFFNNENLAVDEIYLASSDSFQPESYRQIVFVDGIQIKGASEKKLRAALEYFLLGINRQQSILYKLGNFGNLEQREEDFLDERILFFKIMNSRKPIPIPFFVAPGENHENCIPFAGKYDDETDDTQDIKDFEGLAKVDGFWIQKNRIYLNPMSKEDFFGVTHSYAFRTEDTRFILPAIHAVKDNSLVRVRGKALLETMSNKKPIFHIEDLVVLEEAESLEPQLPNIAT